MNNVFDRKPPLMYSAGMPPVNPAYAVDRYWFVSYDQKF